jgi:signal transduction histidine kinase
VDCDATIYHLYGVTKSDSASFFDKWLTCLHEQDRDRVAQAMQEAAAGKADYNTQFRIIQPGGALRHIRSSGIVSRDPAGAALRMTGALWDVTVEETENLALKTATERMRLAADSGEIGILEFDFLSSQLFPDEWSCRILGIAQPPGQTIPADVFSLIVHPDDRERRDKARQDALDGIAPFALDYRILRNDGATRHLKCSATITRDAAGRALRMTGSIQDITARKEIEESLALKAVELAEIALELKRSNGELSQFAAMASHDLQEPLRMVSSYTQLLGKRYKGKLDADADEFIAFAVDGCNRMKQLIKDLLTYSKAGTNGLDLRATSSEEALAGALWNLQGAIQDSGALVTHDAMPAVLADASQLTQLFQNLVGNGIKYRGGEVPRIHISATASAAGRWRFEVRDNGLGIDAEHFERIFGMFQRLHGAGEYSGTGIGLAICKKIVDRHGGVIWVDSKPGAGSGFHFTLAEASSG